MIAFILFAARLLVPVGPSSVCSSHEDVLTKPSFEHALESKHASLDSLEIEDRSVWAVAPPDAYKIVGWDKADTIVITPHSSWFSIYKFQYAMTNTTRQSYVRVNFVSHPGDYQKQTRWVISLDKYGNRVFLNDGSSWKVDPADAKLLQEWSINDFIIYGKNDQYLASFPFLLINARLSHHVHAVEF